MHGRSDWPRDSAAAEGVVTGLLASLSVITHNMDSLEGEEVVFPARDDLHTTWKNLRKRSSIYCLKDGQQQRAVPLKPGHGNTMFDKPESRGMQQRHQEPSRQTWRCSIYVDTTLTNMTNRHVCFKGRES
jgi:hypothetical protein